MTALVTDIINPLFSFVLGSGEGLKQASITIGHSKILWGDFVSAMIDFLILSAVVYFGFKGLGLEKIDKKKEKYEMGTGLYGRAASA